MWLKIRTKQGVFLGRYTTAGLSALTLPDRAPVRSAGPSGDVPASVCRWRDMTERALEALLRGEEPSSMPPLDWGGATAFQRKVWRALLRMRPGQATSYGALARRIGQPGAARAVGAACGANPVPVLVPCHRVLAADGGLGGYSGGLAWKRRLLAGEGILDF